MQIEPEISAVGFYVSITGLKVKRVIHTPIFWSYAVRSMIQARRAPGNISADAATIDGVHHTLSVWTDRAAMMTFLSTGPHLEAMRVFPKIATGKVLSYVATEVPDWSSVHEIWATRGRAV